MNAIEAYRDKHLALFDAQDDYWGIELHPVWSHRAPVTEDDEIDDEPENTWPRVYVTESSRVVVLRGGDALPVPDLLSTLGERGAELELRRQIRRKRSDAAVFKVMAAGGIGSILVGNIGIQSAPVLGEAREWRRVMFGGFVLLAGGLTLAGLPGKRADRLEHDVAVSLDPSRVVREVEAHNRQLAADLGLDEATAARITAASDKEAAPDL